MICLAFASPVLSGRMLSNSPLHPNEPKTPEQRQTGTISALDRDNLGLLVDYVGGEDGLRITLGLCRAELEKMVLEFPGVSQLALAAPDRACAYLFAKWNSATQLYVQNIFVDESARRIHLASSMIEHTVQRARELRPGSLVTAVVLFGNTPAENLFRSAGFQEHVIRDGKAKEFRLPV